tara:strand:- start:1498 stop:3015 length:1518 start_codon:yes stop_codon:yes gene_type:complete
MIFKLFERNNIIGKNQFYLIKNGWNDWWEYETLFSLSYNDENNISHRIGNLKIGQFNFSSVEGKTPEIEKEFDRLDKRFFSIGQDVSYYKSLNDLGDEKRELVLRALNDIAFDKDLFSKALFEPITRKSLFRDVTTTSAQGEFRRLAKGNAELSEYYFSYTSYARNNIPPIHINFSVIPRSNPPTNIHVLIGRNGVGKTFLINNMISSLLNESTTSSKYGYFKSESHRNKTFANLVSVTFSAFDENEPPEDRADRTKGVRYSYIGLKRPKSDKRSQIPKSPVMLKNEFIKSVEVCIRGAKYDRWRAALTTLEADPIFKEAEVASIADENLEIEKFQERATLLFDRLSSGHRIVLLTITRLIETVEERSLVLLDEPETHLHPPLLSAFIRALSDLLIKRNAVAFIATHSPVVLQEIPKSCAWKLNRAGAYSKISKLEYECFGENVGLLTREVFGLEVTQSGFHKLILNLVQQYDNFEDIINHLNNELGMEGQALVRTMLFNKNDQT